MPATTTTLTSLPSLTTNPLDPSQRAHLLNLNSAWRLENRFGATPDVLESDSLALNPTATSTAQHENPKDQHLYFSPYAISSVATSFADSFESHESFSTCQQPSQNETQKTHGGWKSTRLRTLVLRLRKVPSVPFLNDGTKQRSPSSFSSDESTLNSAKIAPLHSPANAMEQPPSPFASEYDPAGSTRKASQSKTGLKRMAKLIRNLGENIKPELVFRSRVPQDQKSKNEPLSRSRSRSLRPICPGDAVSLAEPASTTTLDNLQAYAQQSNVALESSENVDRKRWHRSASIGSLLTRAAVNTNKSTVAQKPASAHGLSRSATTSMHSQDTSCGNRSGWDGEWNIKDSHERAMALRNLKC